MVNDAFPASDGDARPAEAPEAGKQPWFELARVMETAANPTDGEPVDVATLARSAGIAPVVAKRFIRLLKRMREISMEMNEQLGSLLSPSFNNQEMAARVYSRSKTLGDEVLRRLAKGRVTMSELREILNRTETPADVSLRSKIAAARTAGARTMESALREGGASIFGTPYRTLRRPKLRFIGNTGYEVIAVDGSISAGVDVLFPDVRLGHDALDRELGRSLLLAPFFRKFYVAFPSLAETGDGPATHVGDASSKGAFDRDMVSRAIELLDWLKYDWIGVLVALDDKTLKQMRPSAGPPLPDMTGRYGDYIRRYTSAPADNPMKPPPPFALRRRS